MQKEMAAAFLTLMAIGCTSTPIEEPWVQPPPSSAGNVTSTVNTSPFFYVPYKTNEQVGDDYRRLKEGFSGCTVNLRNMDVDGGTEYKNSTSFQPNSSQVIYISNSRIWDGKDIIKNFSYFQNGGDVGNYRYYTNYTYLSGHKGVGRIGWGSLDNRGVRQNCPADTIFVGADREEIKRWFAKALLENSEITGVNDGIKA